MDNQPIRRMSLQTKTLLSQIDYNHVIEKRKQNYQHLNNVLREKNHLQLPLMDSFTCPMVYPFMTNDEFLRGRLIQNKIFVARYWPNVLEWCKEDELENKLVNQIILLVIRFGGIINNVSV